MMKAIRMPLIGTIILIAMILMLRRCGAFSDDKDKVNLYDHVNDSTMFYKNKSNELVARNSVLESEKVSSFLEIQSKDNEIIQLQARVKEYKKQIKDGGSVTNFESGTNINNTTGTIVHDTMFIGADSIPHTSSTYVTNFSNEWIDYTIKASRDSTSLNLKTTDRYSVIIGSERPKWNKKKVSFVDVISESPYTKVKSVKTYKVKDNRKPPRVSLGVQVGYGFSSIIPKPYVGMGLQYNILNLR